MHMSYFLCKLYYPYIYTRLNCPEVIRICEVCMLFAPTVDKSGIFIFWNPFLTHFLFVFAFFTKCWICLNKAWFIMVCRRRLSSENNLLLWQKMYSLARINNISCFQDIFYKRVLFQPCRPCLSLTDTRYNNETWRSSMVELVVFKGNNWEQSNSVMIEAIILKIQNIIQTLKSWQNLKD